MSYCAMAWEPALYVETVNLSNYGINKELRL